MSEDDFKSFAQHLDAAFSLNPQWKPLPPAGKAMFFKAMSVYSIEQFNAALNAHLRDPKVGMFQPTPAHLIGQIESRSGGDGRPGAEEAWALCVKAQDESETVVWTREMQEAFEICRPTLDGRTNTAARMAFKEAYQRLVDEARREHRPARWTVSLGHDPDKRQFAVEQASAAGLLPMGQKAVLLPPPVRERDIDLEGMKRLKEAVAQLVPGSQRARERQAQEQQEEREAVLRKKADIAQQVNQHQH